MMKKFKAALASLALLAGFAGTTAMVTATVANSSVVGAVNPKDEARRGFQDAGGTGAGNQDLGNTIKWIINLILYIVGVAAVIMIVIGGLRYVLSGGDQSSTKAAKDTILYAVIGLVVAIMAYAIVNFVLGAF